MEPDLSGVDFGEKILPEKRHQGEAGSTEAEKDGGKEAAATEGPEARSVWVLRAGAPRAVALHTGLSDGTLTEVVDGDLREGDLVIVDATSPDAPAGPSPSSAPSMRRLF